MVPSITNELNIWLDSLHIFMRTSPLKSWKEDLTTVRTLRTLHLCLNIMSQTFPFHNETHFDNHAHVLEQIIRTIPYSFDLTSIDLTPALWLGATKSRNPEYRRSAVSMLRRTDEKPGACFGRGEMLARSAEKVIEIEEKGLTDVLSCSDVPEEHRVRVMGLSAEDYSKVMTIWFRRTPFKDDTLERANIDIPDQYRRQTQPMQLDAVLAFDWKAI
jgi:hypothetical protein